MLLKEEAAAHPGRRGRVGTQDLLDPRRLPQEFRHRTLVLRNLAPRLELFARRRLERLDEKVPHRAIKHVPSDVEVVAVSVDHDASHVLELGSFGERERIGEHGGAERDERDAQRAGTEVVDEVVRRLGRERASHGVVDSDCVSGQR